MSPITGRKNLLGLFIAATMLLGLTSVAAAEKLEAGFAAVDITPKLKRGSRVYLAGFGYNRRAEGVHDPLYARAVVLKHGRTATAWVSVDLIGLMRPMVEEIRKRLPGFAFVMVASTHNHEGPDTIGLWGSAPWRTGVNKKYLAALVEHVVKAVGEAAEAAVPVTALYGTAKDESLLADSRLPKVRDGVLRTLRLVRESDGKTAGTVVQWNCHPEALGRRNQLITADFPAATIAKLQEESGAPVVLFSGAIGGLMAPPEGQFKDETGKVLREGDFRFAKAYGEAVADLALRAIDSARPIKLTPMSVSTKPIAVPLTNPLYRLARRIGVVERPGAVWTDDPEKIGRPMSRETKDLPPAVVTEVSYLRLGELDVACIPGELYPELVYGDFEEPADPAVDYPDAPLEPTIEEILPGKRWLLFGLACDEIGYIIPKRQWDRRKPYAYGRKNSQYGEVNSCGSEVAPIIMQSLRRRVAELGPAAKRKD